VNLAATAIDIAHSKTPSSLTDGFDLMFVVKVMTGSLAEAK
jgi:hypothetical protein